MLDSKYIGSIYSNEKKSFEVSEGKHTLYVKIDWCRSKKVDFEAINNDIEFECGNSIKDFWHGALWMFYITIFKNSYLWLKRLT
ncbi:hypothetical protein [Clostridium sp. SHJSY1]|uniref:hypothetical protein n=1 Tax=Clostridium sp. SHJSY1 TaxID=2942483 RepID=UPI00287B613A|nr:hypothetical protein [Clostridium sp. SHJSY1]